MLLMIAVLSLPILLLGKPLYQRREANMTTALYQSIGEGSQAAADVEMDGYTRLRLSLIPSRITHLTLQWGTHMITRSSTLARFSLTKPSTLSSLHWAVSPTLHLTFVSGLSLSLTRNSPKSFITTSCMDTGCACLGTILGLQEAQL